MGVCVGRVYQAGDAVNVVVWPTGFSLLSGSKEQMVPVPGVLSEARQKEGNKQGVNQVDEEGAHQRNDDKRQVRSTVTLSNR